MQQDCYHKCKHTAHTQEPLHKHYTHRTCCCLSESEQLCLVRAHLSKAPDNGVGHWLLQHNDGTRLRILCCLLSFLALWLAGRLGVLRCLLGCLSRWNWLCCGGCSRDGLHLCSGCNCHITTQPAPQGAMVLGAPALAANTLQAGPVSDTSRHHGGQAGRLNWAARAHMCNVTGALKLVLHVSPTPGDCIVWLETDRIFVSR